MHATFSGAGKGKQEGCASNDRNMDAQGRENMKCVLEKIGKEESAEKRVKKKRMRAHPFCCIL